MKFPIGNINPGPYLPHPTNTYTCRVTTAPRVCGESKPHQLLTLM